MMSWIQDAGHGGEDPGAVSHGNTEKVYTLEAALYVDKRLADHGITTDLTRSSDVTIGPNQRTTIVSKYKKCISHHFNAGGGSGAEFIHSIYSDGKFENILLSEFKNAGYPVRPRAVYSRRNSSRNDYYYMHRETGNCRTTILEYEFVDGAHANDIKNKAYREGMYECVVRAICKDEGVEYRSLNRNEATSEPIPDPKDLPQVTSFSKYPRWIRIINDTGMYKYANISHREGTLSKGTELKVYGETYAAWVGGGGTFIQKKDAEEIPQTVITGGLPPEFANRVEQYFRTNRMEGSLQFVGKGNPYAKATLVGNELQNFLMWLNDQNWWYKVSI